MQRDYLDSALLGWPPLELQVVVAGAHLQPADGHHHLILGQRNDLAADVERAHAHGVTHLQRAALALRCLRRFDKLRGQRRLPGHVQLGHLLAQPFDGVERSRVAQLRPRLANLGLQQLNLPRHLLTCFGQYALPIDLDLLDALPQPIALPLHLPQRQPRLGLL